VTVPKGEHGAARVEQFEVSETDAKATLLRSMLKGRGYVPAGTYTKLTVGGVLWMSDTPDERRDHHEPVLRARWSHCETALVNGLGLGMVVGALLELDEMRVVDVIELNPDVLALVGPHYEAMALERDKVVRLHLGDAREPSRLFASGQRWGVVWSDIWRDICADDYEEHKAMRRRYARRCDWHGVWCGDIVRRAATGG
jgi:hypothetical protein